MQTPALLRRALALALLLAATVLAGCRGTFFGAINAGVRTPEPVESVVYSPAHALSLDVYRPAAASRGAPVVVFFYGGSWRGGRRGDYAFVGKALARSGVLAVVADYRTWPTGRFPDFAYDGAEALRWAHDHAVEHGGDPGALFVAGHSAGAHIAVLLATDPRYLVSVGLVPHDLAGAIGIAGPYDFLPITDPDLVDVFGADTSAWPSTQPVNFVDGNEPPVLLLHGLADRVVLPANSASLEASLRAHGASVTYLTYPGIGHFRIALALRYPRLAPTLADMLAFIREHAPR